MDSLEFLARVHNIPLASLKLAESLLAGNYRSVFRGPGLEFSEVREYAQEDDSRLIDWRVTSRMNAPYVKTYQEERELILFLMVDVSGSMGTGSGKYSKANMAALLAFLLARAALQNNDRVGAAFFSDRVEHWVPPQRDRRHINRLLKDLREHKPKNRGTNLDQAVMGVQEVLKRKSICVILSDFRFVFGWRELNFLVHKHDVIAIKISDPDEVEFPPLGAASLRDPESRKIVKSFGFSQKFRRTYRDFWAGRDLVWERSCRRMGIDPLTISTAGDPLQELLQFFKRRRRR
ncbi:MAG: DUF58 domain-containing protein [Spirochaetales bacterium]|jgi:uncharacterized protein (DUF58 family)|nr:DUF58 domain-containing protein [Spirochaetales bacterium]